MQEQRSRQAEDSDLTQNYLLPRSAAPLLWAVAGWELNPCRNCWGPTNPCERSFRAPKSKRSKNCSNLFYRCELFTNELTKRIQSHEWWKLLCYSLCSNGAINRDLQWSSQLALVPAVWNPARHKRWYFLRCSAHSALKPAWKLCSQRNSKYWYKQSNLGYLLKPTAPKLGLSWGINTLHTFNLWQFSVTSCKKQTQSGIYYQATTGR